MVAFFQTSTFVLIISILCLLRTTTASNEKPMERLIATARTTTYPGHRKEYCISQEQCVPAFEGSDESDPQKIKYFASLLDSLGTQQAVSKYILPFVPEVRKDIIMQYDLDHAKRFVSYSQEPRFYNDLITLQMINKLGTKTHEFYASDLMIAIQTSNYEDLVEILFANSNKLVKQMKDSFLEVLLKHTGYSTYKDMIDSHLSLFREKRYLKDLFHDRTMVENEESNLIPENEAAKAFNLNDDSGFEWIKHMNKCFVEFSPSQLQRFVKKFLQLQPDLKHERVSFNKYMIGKTKSASYMLQIYEYIFEVGKDPILYLAKKLYNSFGSFFMSHDTIQRIFIARAQIDLKSIELAFDNLPETRVNFHGYLKYLCFKCRNLKECITTYYERTLRYQRMLLQLLNKL